MRIAFLSTFYPYRGGIAQFNASLFRELENQHEIKAFTFKRQYPGFFFPGKTQYIETDNQVNPVPAVRVLDTINPFSYYATAKAINSFSPDLLLMKYWLPYLAPALGSVAKKMNSKTKVISILDNVFPHEKGLFDLPLTRFFINQNDGFIAMNQFVSKELVSIKPGAKSVIAEHPVYNHFGKKIEKENSRQYLKIDTGKKTILFFGLIRDYKGLDLLINAFGRLGKDYQLIIAGESYGDFNKYQNQIDLLPNKKDIFVFNRFIPDAHVPYFFSASDVCVLPYRNITQSGIAGLAYNFDLPLITTNVGGLKEMIHHNKTGLLIDEISCEAIAKTIIYYFENRLPDLFIPQIKKIKSELSWNKFANGIMQFYETLK
jgi:glycosyltransferase involved in cell wall biosynthesis